MTQVITLQLPEPLQGAALLAWLNEHVQLLYPAMDLEVTEYDELAQVDQVVIVSCHMAANALTIQYEVFLSAFYGCSDIHYKHQVIRTLRGEQTGLLMRFPGFIPLQTSNLPSMY